MGKKVEIEAIRSFYGDDMKHFEAGKKYLGIDKSLADAWAERGRVKIISENNQAVIKKGSKK